MFTTYFGLLVIPISMNLHTCAPRVSVLNNGINIITHKSFICNWVVIFFNENYHTASCEFTI